MMFTSLYQEVGDELTEFVATMGVVEQTLRKKYYLCHFFDHGFVG
jgi:hypothetical protein